VKEIIGKVIIDIIAIIIVEAIRRIANLVKQIKNKNDGHLVSTRGTTGPTAFR